MAASAKVIAADVLILGGGPAGLSAATALSRQMIPTIIFDSGRYRNAPTAHMHNVIGFDHKPPSEFRETARKGLQAPYKSNAFVDCAVTGLKKVASGGFEATDANGQTYTSKKIVLATGVKDVLPAIEGFDATWGSAVFHCLFCHGFEERGSKKAALLVDGPLANPAFLPHVSAIAGMAQRMADKVVLYTNGNEDVKTKLESLMAATILTVHVDPRKISKLEKLDMESTERLAVYFADGEKDVLGFMVHLPNFEVNVPVSWREQLGIELNEMGDLQLDQKQQTTCPGIYAAGDHNGMMKTVPHALFTGSTAGGYIVHDLVLGH